jgi:hypothetical protein
MTTFYLGFVFLIALASFAFTLYLLGVLISCWVTARQERAAARRRASNHRVGGVISP